MKQDMILIIDLGSVENAALARKLRAMGVYSEIQPHDISAQALAALPNVRGVILNSGRNRVVDGVYIQAGEPVKALGVPMLAREDGQEPDLEQFVFGICGAEKTWNMENFIADQVELLRRQIGDGKVLLALSGGVDSSVVAALLLRAVGDRLTCVHVNHGLLRKGEPEQVVRVFREELGANLIYVDAVDRFLDKLAGVDDPERKRKIIGEEFIRVFEEEAAKLDGIRFLGQGTIYPDILESGTKTAKAVKAHHNVGGLPEKLGFELVEPLKMLFKDEVRACGRALGLPESMVNRQPFPGPGLGVRCTGAITRDRLDALREADAILREEFALAGLDQKVWQYFTVVPDYRSTGVREGARCFEWPCVVRAVNSVDAMTAEVEELSWPLMHKLALRIPREVKGINRVLIDISPKPVATIEWE